MRFQATMRFQRHCSLCWKTARLPCFCYFLLDINTAPQTDGEVDQRPDRLNRLIIQQREVEMKTNQTELGSSQGNKVRKLSMSSLLPPPLYYSRSLFLPLWQQRSPNHSTCFPHHLFLAIPLGAE